MSRLESSTPRTESECPNHSPTELPYLDYRLIDCFFIILIIVWFILVAPVEEAAVVTPEEAPVVTPEEPAVAMEESTPVKPKMFPVDVENDSLEQVFCVLFSTLPF